MKRILSYLKDYKKECILGPLFKLLEAGFELFVPLVCARIIDFAIPQSDRASAVKLSLVLVLLGIVGFISAVTAQYFAAKASCGFAKKLKHGLFAHLQTLSHSELETIGTSTMITRMTSDMNQLQTGVNMAIRLFLRSPFVVFGAMIMAFTIDVKAALIFAVTIPLLSVAVFAIILGCMPLYKKAQARLDSVLQKTRENLSGVRVIRAFRLEDSEREEFRRRNGELNSVQRFVGRISSLMNPITYVMLNVAIILLIYVGALRVDSGRISQGEVFALYNYMSQILVELVKLANLIVTVTKAVACAGRVSAVFDIKNSVESGSLTEAHITDGADAVVFDSVGLRYSQAGEESLTDISFSVKIGESVGIIGATGSGKTSLVNLIPRFYEASSGKITVFGKDIKEYDTAFLRSKIGIVPQKAVLFKGTVRDNMKWGKEDASDEEIWAALETAQAKEVVTSKGGLSAQVEAGGGNFSGGQKQRLTIARAIVGLPEILIFDDSSSALDFATDAALRRAISQIEGSHTLFTVSQRPSTIMHCDKIIVLDDGRQVGIGTHEELLRTCEVYREICDSQLGGGER